MQPARSSHHFENSFEKKNRFETAELGSWASLRRPRSGRQSQVLQSSRLSCGPATTIPGARQDPSSPDSPEAPDHAYPLRLREAPPPASGETGAGRAERLVAPARRPRGAASLLSKRLAGTVGGCAVAVWSAGQQRAPSSLGLAVAPQLSREQRRKSWPSSSIGYTSVQFRNWWYSSQILKAVKSLKGGSLILSATRLQKMTGIPGPKLKLANKPSCACIVVSSSVVSWIRNLGHNNSTDYTLHYILQLDYLPCEFGKVLKSI
ncbi:uncharacterized protein LOC144291394 isoform X4 [Canis aureus]